MTRYFGVLCKNCNHPIPLAVKRPTVEGRAVNIYTVPLEPLTCSKCKKSFPYEKSDATEFEGEDGLLT